MAGVTDDGCGIVSLDNLPPFHKKFFFLMFFENFTWKKTMPFILRQHGREKRLPLFFFNSPDARFI